MSMRGSTYYRVIAGDVELIRMLEDREENREEILRGSEGDLLHSETGGSRITFNI